MTSRLAKKVGCDPRYIDFIDNDGWARHVYRVDLTYKGRNFTTEFSMGIGLEREPTSEDVLYALIADAETIESAGDSFEEWCSMLGYSTDSIKDNKTFEDCKVNTAGVKYLMGRDWLQIRKELADV